MNREPADSTENVVGNNESGQKENNGDEGSKIVDRVTMVNKVEK